MAYREPSPEKQNRFTLTPVEFAVTRGQYHPPTARMRLHNESRHVEVEAAAEPVDPHPWKAWAACRESHPSLFYVERGASTKEPKEICAGCIVREECLEYALVNREFWGIWGGTSERERRRLRRQRRVA